MRTPVKVASCDSDFLRALDADPGIRCAARWGLRCRLRRWMNATCTPALFADDGSLFGRTVRSLGFVIFGGPVQLMTDLFTKGIAVQARNGRAGLDLTPLIDDGRPAWKITRFWAWPLGQGHGRVVSAAVLNAADRTGTVVVLQAGNQTLAREIYLPDGFSIVPGEERSHRPNLVREPVRRTAEVERFHNDEANRPE